MCKLIEDKTEMEELINAFFFPLFLVKKTLKRLSEGHNGIAYGSDITLRLSTWYEDDEKDSDDYIGDGNAAFIGWKPYFEEDIIAILTNEQFMEYLKEYASIYLKEQPGDKKQIDIYLKLIKNRLNL